MTIKSRSPSTTLTQALHRCGLGRDDTRNNGMTSAIRGLHLQERTTTSGKRSATSGTLAVLAQASCLSFFLSVQIRGMQRQLPYAASSLASKGRNAETVLTI